MCRGCEAGARFVASLVSNGGRLCRGLSAHLGPEPCCGLVWRRVRSAIGGHEAYGGGGVSLRGPISGHEPLLAYPDSLVTPRAAQPKVGL